MLYILVIILLLISIIGVVIVERKKSPTLSPTLGPISSFGTIIFIICFVICSRVFVEEGNLYPKLEIASLNKEHDFLVYQLENQLYIGDVERKELYNKITEWNTDLAFKKEVQRDFWVGIFYPNIYDEIDFIEME